jgi:hypothetical protein
LKKIFQVGKERETRKGTYITNFKYKATCPKNIKRGINKGKGGGEQTTAQLQELTVHQFCSNL